MRADVFPHLVMPVGPFVPAFRAPVIEVVSYAAALEHLGHSVSGAGDLPWAAASGEVDVAGRKLLEEPGIILVGHVVDGIIEVEVVVVHSVHGIAQIVNARERVAALYTVGMLEEGVG